MSGRLLIKNNRSRKETLDRMWTRRWKLVKETSKKKNQKEIDQKESQEWGNKRIREREELAEVKTKHIAAKLNLRQTSTRETEAKRQNDKNRMSQR